jgi:hypothetical protein
VIPPNRHPCHLPLAANFRTQGPGACPRPALLLLILTLGLAGCRSNVVELDQRPAWVMEAEQRLQQEPAFDVDRRGADTSRPLWRSQPTEGAATPQASRSAEKDRFSRRSAKADLQPGSSQSTMATPGSVSWSETKITVEVED